MKKDDKLAYRLNVVVRHARNAKAERLNELVQGRSLATAIENLAVAMAIANGLTLKPETEHHSIAAIDDPIASAQG